MPSLTLAPSADVAGPLAAAGQRAGADSGDPQLGVLVVAPDAAGNIGVWECRPGGWPVDRPSRHRGLLRAVRRRHHHRRHHRAPPTSFAPATSSCCPSAGPAAGTSPRPCARSTPSTDIHVTARVGPPMTETLHHWAGGAALKRHQRPLRRRHRPGHRRGHRPGRRSPPPTRSTPSIAAAKAAFPAWRDTSLARRTPGPLPLPRAAQRPRAASSPRSSPPSTARCSPTPPARSPAARRSSSSPAACRTCSRAGTPRTRPPASTSHSIRQPLGVVGIISPFNFPAMVPMWFFPIAIAAGNTVVLKPSEKVPTAALWIAELWKEAGLPDGVFNVLHGDKAAVDGLLTHPDVKRDLASSAPPRSPATSTRPAPRTASGCRPSAGRRTTWSCCPTPTSTSPPTRPSTPASARPASAAWRSPRWSRSGDVADALVEKIAERARGAAHRRRTPRLRHGPARHRRRPGPGHRLRRRRRGGGRDRSSSTAATGRVRRRRRRASSSARPCSTTSRTDMTIYTDEIFGPVLSVAPRRHLRRGRRPDQRQPVRQRHRDLHQRRRRRPPVPERGRGRHDRHQRAGPGARWPTTPSAAGRTRCSATPTPTAPRASTSSPAARSSPPAGSTPSHGGLNLGFPQNA